MTEAQETGNAAVGSDAPEGAASQPAASAGQLLREARERKHVPLAALASALKVPEHKLQALEEDRWDVLTDAVFARALAMSVCRVLQVPAEEVLARLPKHESSRLSTHPEGINAPFKDKTLRSLMSAKPDHHSGRAGKWMAALLVVAVAGAGLYFVPQWQSAPASDVAAVNAPTDVALVQPQEPVFMPIAANHEAPAAPEAAMPVLTQAPAVSAEPVDVAVVPPVAVAAQPQVQVAIAESAPSVAVPVAQADAPSGAMAPALRFVAQAETWVQVRSAQGGVVMEKVLKAGDVYEERYAGRPLQVVVGNASATRVEVNGAAFELATSARSNVARFEVK